MRGPWTDLCPARVRSLSKEVGSGQASRQLLSGAMIAPCPPVAPQAQDRCLGGREACPSLAPVPPEPPKPTVRALRAPAATLGSIPPAGVWPLWASSAGSLDPAVPCHVPWHLGGACLLHQLPLSSPKVPPALLTLPSPVPGSPLLLLPQGPSPPSCQRANMSPSRVHSGIWSDGSRKGNPHSGLSKHLPRPLWCQAIQGHLGMRKALGRSS